MHTSPASGRGLLLYGARILLAIALAELAIMLLFQALDLDARAWWNPWLDAALLSLLAAPVIHVWVVAPLARAARENEIFAKVSQSLDVGLVVTDPRMPDNPIISINPAFTRITGYSPEEAIGRNPRFLQGPETDPETIGEIRRGLSEGRNVHVLQKNHRRDGSTFWNDLRIGPVMDADGTPRYFVGLVTDVSERVEREQQLHRVMTALEQSDEAMCTFGPDGIIEFANEAFARSVGMRPDALIGESVLQFWDVPGGNREAFRQLREALKEGHSWSGRHQRRRKDGSIYEALTSITPVIEPDGRQSFVAVHRDVTSMVELEAQMRQAQKMEAIGTLVGGIAHDFNNVLAGMLGNLFMIRRELEDRPELKERVQLVETQGYGAAGMIRQLLTFSRQGVVEHKDFELKPFIKELLKFARASIPENIDLVCELTDEPCPVHGDPTQLQQSLLNLLTNAQHAIREKGADTGRIEIRMQRLSVRSRPQLMASLKQHHPHPHRVKWTHLTVRDDGCGMDEATMQRIFEPFFTTKGSGIGTGLGLAMVRGNIESMGGMIEVESTPGEGSCFHLYLPCYEHVRHAEATDGDARLDHGQGELILVADDDVSVLTALSDLLQDANYRVLTARDGAEALRLIEAHRQELRLAILDIIMPKATGVQVANHLHDLEEAQPMPVVFMTGYDKEDAVAEHYLGDVSPMVINKPWDMKRLNEAIRQALKRPVAALTDQG